MYESLLALSRALTSSLNCSWWTMRTAVNWMTNGGPDDISSARGVSHAVYCDWQIWLTGRGHWRIIVILFELTSQEVNIAWSKQFICRSIVKADNMRLWWWNNWNRSPYNGSMSLTDDFFSQTQQFKFKRPHFTAYDNLYWLWMHTLTSLHVYSSHVP